MSSAIRWSSLLLVFALCSAAPAQAGGERVDLHTLRVVDGDTVVIGRERIRISNLDAPEMPGHAFCDREEQLARQAKQMLHDELFGPGKAVVLVRDVGRTHDKYGRTLAHLTVDGVDVADGLIAAGVARPWRGRSSNYCGTGPKGR